MANRHEACKYLSEIMSLCQISNSKFEDSGVDIYTDPSIRERAYQCVPVADMFCVGFVRRAEADECQLGHAEVIADFRTRQTHGPAGESLMTSTFRSYHIMMGKQVERKPFVTRKVFVGLAPKHVEEGDVIVVFSGAKFPYIWRKHDDGTYVLVGEAFVHSLMYGEWMNESREMQYFVLK
jgi:hypothetical protein